MKWFAVACVLFALACGKEPTQQQPPRAEATPIPKPLDAPPPAPPKLDPIARDLDAIRGDKTLRVLFTFNSTGYLVFRGETMGYEYELLSKFAKGEKVKLVPVVVRDSATLIERLNKGDGDVIAAQLVAPSNESEILATDGLYETSPAVVQRGGGSPAQGHSAATATAIEREQRETGEVPVTIRARLVARPSELAGQNVHLSRRSPYRATLLELNDDGEWDDVAYWLIRKSKRAVYNDPVVKYGFARGTEPVDYVERILDRFEHYKAFVENEPAIIVESGPTAQ